MANSSNAAEGEGMARSGAEDDGADIITPSPATSVVGNNNETWEQVPVVVGPVPPLRSYKDPLRELHPSSAVIHAGYHNNLSERAIKPPVFKSSTFVFANAEEGELFFQRAYGLEGNDGKPPGLVYSRLNNPNTEILEDKMVALEEGSNYCGAFPSGMSAISTSIMALVPKNGHIMYTNPVYGGTYFFLKAICPDRFGVTSQGVDTSDKECLDRAIQDGEYTREAIRGETVCPYASSDSYPPTFVHPSWTSFVHAYSTPPGRPVYRNTR
jgi:Cys/Met metabolism PLP-dependent enzyme